MTVNRRAAWIGSVPPGWAVVEPRRLFALRREPELAGDLHLTPSQMYGVVTQQEYMAMTGAQVVQNLSGTLMQHVEPGDFISHLRTFQGGLELSMLGGKVSPAYTVVEPREGTDPRFYRHVLKSRGYISQIASVTDQLRDGQSMRWAEFNLTWLPRPPLAEQRQIADYLDHETAEIDAFIADLESLRTSLQEHRMSELASLLPYSAELFRPDASSVVPMRHLGSITLGKMLDTTPPTEANQQRYLRAANIQPLGRLDLNDLKSMRFTPMEREALDLRAGDVVIVEGGQGGFGRAAYVRANLPELGFQNSIVRFRPNRGVDGRYVAYSLHLLRHAGYIRTVASVTSMPHFTGEKVAVTPIPLATPERQHEVADALDARWSQLNDISADIDAAIALAKERRAALITAAVTGQIDVTTRQRPVVDSIQRELEEAR